MRIGLFQKKDVLPQELQLVDTKLSFVPYINYLQKRIKDERDVRATLFRFILRRFEQHPELMDGEVNISNFAKYNDVIPLIEDTVFPLIHDDNESMFALSEPLSPRIFYCTEAFYRICIDPETNEFKPIKNIAIDKAYQFRLSWIYKLIADRLFNVKTAFEGEMVHLIKDHETGLNRYFKTNIDTRFIDVKVDGEMPLIDVNALISELTFTEADLAMLQEKLPLDKFSFEGFAIIGLTDVTAAYSTETIKNAIINTTSFNSYEYFGNIETAIRTLLRNKDIKIGLLPFLKVNEKFVLDEEANVTSILVNSSCKFNCKESNYATLVDDYSKKTKPFFVPDINSKTIEKYPFLQSLKDDGFNGFMIIPLSWNNQLMGVLELATVQKNELNEKIIPQIDNLLPLLAQVLKHRIEAFENNIKSIIKEKFTSLQPAVEWKFNEVAWEYLQKSNRQKKEVSNIYFKDVYPLYGAIDIRNSSVERNLALQSDMREHFVLLLKTLDELKKFIKLNLLDETVYKCKKLMARTNDFLTTDDEIKLADFFENDIKPFLTHFRDNFPDAKHTVEEYLKQTDPETGTIFENRRQLETSIQLINTTVSNFLETQRDELQKAYPTYFEKFRSDGVEYDIYIGQSISPHKPFNPLFLKNLRLWQVASMAEIARVTHTLLPTMDKELHTTQLILVHTNTIDISFRNDERRFDVEGAYNIRYEVIKKRIDKVHTKITGERLTQPGTIALVYFNNKDAEEYLKYIQYLQNGGYLLDNIEHFELEDLQGVSGLKAIRVGVSLD